MKTTAEMIAVMQAFDRGEVIQHAPRDTPDATFQDIPETREAGYEFNWQIFDYRRAPKVIYVNECRSGRHAAYSSAKDAKQRKKSYALRCAVKYVEEV